MNIVTATGRIINPLDPDPEQFDIEDIAHALANTCRFNGHTNQFYSVAEHSIRVAAIVPLRFKLTALLHDASEAYLADIARPVKHDPDFGPFYRSHEYKLERMLAQRFGLIFPMPAEVKNADNVLLATEQRDLMPNVLREPGFTLPETIEPAPAASAKKVFLLAYDLLRQRPYSGDSEDETARRSRRHGDDGPQARHGETDVGIKPNDARWS